ncbi:MAG: hypothetical protein DIJKHBIC_00645 [Thermoanaerobaculia bacterium]|nr:hypothetical protein [Thermoanaerobaculia bacterium]
MSHRKSDAFRAPRSSAIAVLLSISLGCGGQVFEQPVTRQRLPSGKTVDVTSCLLVWGIEHDERDPRQDSFALEYVTKLSESRSGELDREALEVFELIRPVSELWGYSTASVAAFPSRKRSGKYDIFTFSRAPSGTWTVTRQAAKVFNTESGHKP